MSVVCCVACGFPVPNHEITKGTVGAQPPPLRNASDVHVPILDPLTMHHRIVALEAGAKADKDRFAKLEKLAASRK